VTTNLVQLKKIRVGIVNYLNTRPLLYGLERNPIRDQLVISLDYPAKVAAQLKRGEIDLGLVPVALLKEAPHLQRVGTHCIATNGEIASVCLFSQVPIEQVETILLDYQSRTSAALARILIKHHFKKEVVFKETTADEYIGEIRGSQAGLIIGDRALQCRSEFPYRYDLGTEWKSFSGLPFVFAAWLASEEMPGDFLSNFDAANQEGLSCLPEVVAGIQSNISYDLLHYFTKNVQYQWHPDMEKALQLFLHLAE